ncbi:PD-(D/E)XK motif protein [Rhizobium leguminosarum]|uniref:PD-(D/E)XK motif protein n=1 Tax=Rhizobium leguminosarum TaxID=384 RepID=UPI001C921AA2|nr:PD-(D/E)XK motif protein [Rhizobium leguminosarum]MBY3044850.1 PD-(D/E)XK motif protein [Rhizobium leguminosarum]
MTNELPWSSIDTPVSGYLWKRHHTGVKHVFWWGKDHLGRPVLLLQLSTTAHFVERRRPSVAGLGIEFVVVDNGKFEGLKVTLLTPDADIFHSLCLILISVAEAVETETQALASVVTHVERWQSFLAAARRDVLTGEEARGLYAELVMINQFIDTYGRSASEVVVAWGGPLGRPQDFHFADGYVEVKAVGGRYGNAVLISSEYQLDVASKSLCLVAVELKEAEDDHSGLSLNQLVAKTLGRIGAEGGKLFEDRVLIAGYIPRPEYDFPAYQVEKIFSFQVDDNFPSICASKLKVGLSNVKYRVDLTEAATSRIPQLTLWTKTENG